MTTLHSYLKFAGNAEEAFNFYKSVFGGEFSSLVRFNDLPLEGVTVPEEDQDKMRHIGLPIGEDQMLMASDTLESLSQKLVQGNNVYISVHPESRERRTGYSTPSPEAERSRCRLQTSLGATTTAVSKTVRCHVDGQLQPAA